MNEQNVILEEDGFEEEIDVLEEASITMATWGDITGNIDNQTDLKNALDAKQDSLSQAQLDATNSGITNEKVAKYDGYEATINAKADQSALDAETTARGEADTALGTRIDNEVTTRQNADNSLQSQIDAITSKSDVVDVVANYAALQAYDTSSLGNNDVIKVLDDETHEDALTYYRWSTTTQTWTYIGQEAPYYSKGQMDVMLQGKQDTLTAGANIQIQNGTISATDTTYTAGNGLNLNGTEFSADTDVLATKADLESYYTKPETDNLLAPKLEAEVVAELPATGTEGKLYLTPKAHTTQTATGNPITATITDEAGKIESFKLDGDTYQQTYTGKNLAQTLDKYTYNRNGGATIESQSDGTVVFKTSSSSVSSGVYIYETNGDNATLCPELFTAGYVVSFDVIATATCTFEFGVTGNHTTTTISTTKQRVSVATATGAGMVFYNNSQNGVTITISNIQVEAGSTASSFEPYVGGTPSPNPDYPQPIQTVTGEQTVTINGTDYTLDLGNIELNNLGDTYLDRIYKDGDDWKIRKNTNRFTFETRKLLGLSKQNSGFVYNFENNPLVGRYVPLVGECSHFDVETTTTTWTALNKTGMNSLGALWFRTTDTNQGDTRTVDEFGQWLVDAGVSFVYAIATPTDTVITDTTLIAQLEAIRTASLQNGTNTITNTATGSNLAGDMEIGYYGFAPRNRYDKWLWLDINNEYEQIGS